MLNQDIVFKDTYWLLCIFLADRAIFDITPEGQQVWGGSQRSTEPLFRLRYQFMEDEINHTLIKLAICNRTHMDLKKENHEQEYPDHACGNLIKNEAIGSTEPLTFREACNKIIHANKFQGTFLKSGEVEIFCGETEPMHHEMRVVRSAFRKKMEGRTGRSRIPSCNYRKF